ncbi:uncharacterized protein LOC135397816 [Ornithodoros turicata]|uniref:uncharacterized protein LOC135397816 n=1 Tax=Ornithodoros turicata TaxID=34597 RepID=UPI00313A0429
MPLRLQSTERLLRQLDRLHKSQAGRNIIRRINEHRGSRFKAMEEGTYRLLALPGPEMSPPPAPFDVEEPEVALSIRGLRKKREIPDTVIRSMASELIHEQYGAALHVYTDGSSNQKLQSSTAAFWIPALQHSWGGRLDSFVSSTLAEQVAIERALVFVSSIPAQDVLILSDSKCALQRIARCRQEDTSTRKIVGSLRLLKENGSSVKFQWIPSHVGINGNEKADSVAAAAHTEPPNTPAPHDPDINKMRFSRHIQKVRLAAIPAAAIFQQPLPTRDLKRRQAVLLHRLRTKSVLTPALLHKMGFAPSPHCDSCSVHGDLEHVMMHCSDHKTAREAMLHKYKALNLPRDTCEDILYPQGSALCRRAARDELLAFAASVELS